MWNNIETEQAVELINKEIGVNPGYFFIGDDDLIKQFDKYWREKKYKMALNLLIDIENLKDLKEYMKENYAKGGGVEQYKVGDTVKFKLNDPDVMLGDMSELGYKNGDIVSAKIVYLEKEGNGLNCDVRTSKGTTWNIDSSEFIEEKEKGGGVGKMAMSYKLNNKDKHNIDIIYFTNKDKMSIGELKQHISDKLKINYFEISSYMNRNGMMEKGGSTSGWCYSIGGL